MPTSGSADSSPPPRPSRYESQKRRDWQTFTRYLSAHRPPLHLRQCSGAHVLEFLRYLDRFGKTRVHALPCPSYGGAAASSEEAACQCPLRQAWGSLDALVGRLRAAFDERHGGGGAARAATTATTTAAAQQPENAGGGAASNNNPFAARAVRLYLRDVRDAQARARGISYSRRKKRRPSNKEQQGHGGVIAGEGASAASVKEEDGGVGRAAPPHVNATSTTLMAPAVAQTHAHLHPNLQPPPAYLTGVPFECYDYYYGSGGGGGGGGATTAANGGAAGFYLPLLFNTFGYS
ncbi:hypothetical protein HU200_028044 [Digitaria exilis]|uniref:ALOG domain-containing protein n=1 Tax=Digitaria exilis TaxID=1010633 RepID=A0A835C4H0_9POAL|nr:hypothetical protein HU200_028044 [Digitaria exilis]